MDKKLEQHENKLWYTTYKAKVSVYCVSVNGRAQTTNQTELTIG